MIQAEGISKKWENVREDFVKWTEKESIKKVLVPDFRQLIMRAASLVYTTLVALVPLLALAFALLPTLEDLEKVLLASLDHLGDKKHEIVRHIVKYVKELHVEELHLGTPVIFVSLLAIYLLLALKTEKVFNELWHIPNKRNFRHKVTEYIVAILVGPVLILAGRDLADPAMQWLSSVGLVKIDIFYNIILSPVSYILILVAFVFLFIYMPNTKVKWGSAFVGSLFACVLWLILIRGLFPYLISLRSGIYGSFAGALLFIFWVYWGWLIILLGAKITFYFQYRKHWSSLMQPLSNHDRAEVALDLMVLIAQSNRFENKNLNLKELVDKQPRLLSDTQHELLDLLKQKGFISEDEHRRFQISGDTDKIKIKEILNLVRGEDTVKSHHAVTAIMDEINKKIDSVVGERTLKDLIEEIDDDREGASSSRLSE